jgi:hypothetical protein
LPPAGGQAPQQQQQQQRPQQPAAAAAKPYQPVAISAPAPVNDPSFEAFRKQLGAVAERKDRRALAGLVARTFFWIGETGDKADKKKPGIDNLARAIGLDGREGVGWDRLLDYSAEPTGTASPDLKDTICAPAEPNFDGQAFDELLKTTATEEGDWGYPLQAETPMRAAPQPNAPTVDKLGMHFIRVLDEDTGGNQDDPMIKVVAPSGKTGFIPADAISPLGIDQICYVKEAGGWKIAGFVGGE